MAVGASDSVSAPLVERDGEVAALDALLSEAADGRGGVAWIEGPPGIGKTRLVAEARKRATARGLTVLSAQASEFERGFAFGVVRQLFERRLAMPDERARAFDGAAASAAPVFGAPTDEGADPSFATLHGLFWLTVNLTADAPLLLIVDDVHWADMSSLRFLGYLSRRVDDLPVAILAASRPDDGAAASLLAAIHDAASAVLRPAPLTDNGVRAVLGPGADDDLCAACTDVTGGNPLMVHEVVRELDADADAAAVRQLGQGSAARAVLTRLGRESADAIAVARAVAVLGDRASLPTIAALADIDEETAARATGSLAAAEILGQAIPVGFLHPVAREAVYGAIAPGERDLLHARAADLLHGSAAPAEQVAAHLLAGPRRPEPWAAATLVDAGRAALRQGAAESAVGYLRRALEEPVQTADKADLLATLGMAEALTRGPAAVAHLHGALEATRDPVPRARLALDLGRILLHAGRDTGRQVVELSEQAAAALGPDDLDLRQQLESNVLTAGHFDPSAVPDLSERLERHARQVEGDGAGAGMLAAAAAQHCLMQNGPADRCADLAHRVVANRAVLGTDAGSGAVVSAIVALALADREEAVGFSAQVLEAAHRRGSIFFASAAYIFNGFARMLRGDLDDAESALRVAFDNLELWGMAHAPSPAAFLAEVLMERGDLAGAAAALDRAGLPHQPPDGVQLNWWLASRLRLTMRVGRAHEALALADDCERRFRDDPPAWMPWRSLKAQALAQADRTNEAAALAAEEVRLARAFGAPRTLGRALICLGTIKDSVDTLREAADVLDGSTARVEHARALAALGTSLRSQGHARDAREPLARALDVATVRGATALADAARTGLRAAGARPRTTALEGVDALTPSERRVADLAASGLSNKDIAQELYVVPRTVEVHLTNAYRKLGIRSRRKLPGALATP
jgi:DNA-binding CsgD family transcriptional regulator/tetratricopeptide (TPR) repeat protein